MSKNVKISNPMKVITGVDTRWSYANVWEPKSINGGTPKYSVSLIIPKSDTKTVAKINIPKNPIKTILLEKAESINNFKKLTIIIYPPFLLISGFF